MRILKIIGLIVLGLVALLLIAGAFMKKDFHFERGIEISAPSNVVWDNVAYFKNHEKWSQWKELDPAMNVTISGTDGEKGAKMSWTSKHKEVGNGSQTITAIDPGKRIDTELDFEGQGKANAYYTFSGDSSKCNVIWALDMKASYPMNAIMGLFMSEKVMNDMFDKGLSMLKTASESGK